MNASYTAVVKQDAGWWIGWIEEVPGVNCQEATRDELIESLRVSLREADVPVTDLELAGLPAPSLIRAAKIATIDAADATRLGKVSAAALRKVLAAIGRELGVRD